MSNKKQTPTKTQIELAWAKRSLRLALTFNYDKCWARELAQRIVDLEAIVASER